MDLKYKNHLIRVTFPMELLIMIPFWIFHFSFLEVKITHTYILGRKEKGRLDPVWKMQGMAWDTNYPDTSTVSEMDLIQQRRN